MREQDKIPVQQYPTDKAYCCLPGLPQPQLQEALKQQLRVQTLNNRNYYDKILQDKGISVAPFKAQNVSNNAYVCDDGSEIGVAQYFQAKVLDCPTSYHLNPVHMQN